MKSFFYILKLTKSIFESAFSHYNACVQLDFFFPLGTTIASPKQIIIGENFGISKRCVLSAFESKIVIKDNVKLNSDVKIIADLGGKIFIGENVLIGPNTTIRSANHIFSDRKIPIYKQGHSKGDISIANDVWIAANVVILAGVTIGEGSVIGAGSVVTNDVPEFSIAAGVPAKIIGKRF
jgi:acetyltransferase-like isoleucine patch superfamily enzyme